MTEQNMESFGLSMSPAARLVRAQEKRAIVIEFLVDEGWSSTGVIQELLGLSYSTTHSLLKVMVGEGLLRQKLLFIAGAHGARQVMLHGITAHGVAMSPITDGFARQPWDAAKTNALAVPHQLLTQQMRLRAEKSGWSGWIPARRLMGQGLAKLPDAQALSPEGVMVGVEIERHIKSAKRYESILGAYIYEIRNHARWQRVDYICPDTKFAERMAAAFVSLKQLRLEAKGLPSRSAPVEQLHLDRFRYYSQEAWPAGEYIVARKQP